MMVLFFIVVSGGSYAEDSYPRIQRLDGGDVLFLQCEADIIKNREQLVRSSNLKTEEKEQFFHRVMESLVIYSYKVQQGDDLFTIAARCNLPYETISTLNRIAHPSDLTVGTVILLPTLPGLFIPTAPQTDLELIMHLAHKDEASWPITLQKGTTVTLYRVYPGLFFTPTERAFFLQRAFTIPLRRYTISSGYGLRRSPFDNTIQHHQGIDLVAPEGTEVYPTRPGKVIEKGYTPIYGNYVILSHEGGWTSLYGHLKTITVDLHKEVFSSTVIGTVGTTGQSTGPHLHFEIRQNGESQDPARLIPLQGKRQ